MTTPTATSGFPLPPLSSPVRTIGARTIDFSARIAVMAIVNRTPDSFFDCGRTFALDRAVDAALAAATAGADWVDIGGVKFAPGPEVSASEELDRVLPVVQAVAAQSDVVISVDTFRIEVAEACIAAGASVVNDTTGLQNPALAELAASTGATLVITHSLAQPRTAYAAPRYDDVVQNVADFLRERVELATDLGLDESQIIIDPGHDLNKNTLHSLEITRRFDEIARIGLPAIAAVSNKDFVGESLGAERDDRVDGSLAAATACALLGARIVRMHDVARSVQAMRMTETILGLREPEYLRHNMTDQNE
ncbi:dihydropteroate synthase [Agreia sp. VKM Ac-1783]|uniref:dihydropteroate synthase n=1 Tax=Agreia sp. VKM Ac-1783 TaxID=1938889 RepID=UPI000A2ADB9A|nr:dihydropteroate synthase [Agreia sp. VKM Ac-1783]SMQ61342.1 dihydropteroate synthase [Agreia sp. VKM Ac-1783]